MISKLCATSVFIFLFVHSIFAHAAAQSAEAEIEQLLTLDFATLTTVSIASKKEETINDAAGIISVVSADEIKRYGYRNLRDILDRQAHIQVTGSNLFPHDRVTMRGAAFSHTDNTVLLLLNGRPIRDASGSSVTHDIYEAFPVEVIKQIEIVRGPGSVLYGTNAFAGAINIVTKDAPDTPSGNVQLTYGSFDTKRGSLTGGGKLGDFEFFGSVKGMDIEGDDFNNITDEAGNVGSYETGSTGGQLVLNAKYKGFTLNALVSDTTRDHARSSFILPSTDTNTKREFFDLGYKHDWGDNWNSTLNVLFHRHRYGFFLNASSVDQYGDSNHYLAELSNRGQLTDDLSVLFGGTYSVQDGYIKTSDFRYDDYSLGLYGQLEYQMTDWLKLIGGGQFNRPEGLDGDY